MIFTDRFVDLVLILLSKQAIMCDIVGEALIDEANQAMDEMNFERRPSKDEVY